MVYKVAVASSDGKRINAHFNRTRQFLIYDLQTDGASRYVESRLHVPANPSGEHNEDALQKTFRLVSDCDIVLVGQIGSRAERLLNQQGIRTFTIYDDIEKTLGKLADFYRKTHQNRG